MIAIGTLRGLWGRGCGNEGREGEDFSLSKVSEGWNVNAGEWRSSNAVPALRFSPEVNFAYPRI